MNKKNMMNKGCQWSEQGSQVEVGTQDKDATYKLPLALSLAGKWLREAGIAILQAVGIRSRQQSSESLSNIL